MRHAYTLLGLSFLIVFVGAYVAVKRAEAPTQTNEPGSISRSSSNATSSMSLTLTSPVFENNGLIPAQYTCDGTNTPPPLTVSGVPDGTKTLVLVMDDPDIPQAVKDAHDIEKFDHWALYNISADTTEITATSGTAIENGAGATGYTGPCPPTQYEPTEHRYVFRLYALPGPLNFIKAPTLDELETAAKGSALARSTLVGRYDCT